MDKKQEAKNVKMTPQIKQAVKMISKKDKDDNDFVKIANKK